MKQVWDHYGRFTGVQLSALTHQEGTPWAITRRFTSGEGIISNDLIEQHYKELSEVA